MPGFQTAAMAARAAFLTRTSSRCLSPSGLGRAVRSLGFAGILLAALIASGCAPAAMSPARREMQAGNYPAARRDLVALEAHESKLSEPERRELHDDLCLSDFMIGAPAYSLREQRRECVRAATMPGSQSGVLVERIDSLARKTAQDKVAAALEQGDLATAENAATAYANIPDSDPALIATWSQQMWGLVRQQDGKPAGPRRKKDLAAAIIHVRRQYPRMKSMSKSDFVGWVVKEGTVGGTSMFSYAELRENATNLMVHAGAIHITTLNLDRLTKINDATVARCRCDGQTNVAIAETGFPLYLVRLDLETRGSEVLILSDQQ